MPHRHVADRIAELLPRHAAQQHPSGSGLHCLEQVVLDFGSDHDDHLGCFRQRQLGHDVPNCPSPVTSGRRVDQHDMRSAREDQSVHVVTDPRKSDHGDPARFVQRSGEAAPGHLFVVGQKNPHVGSLHSGRSQVFFGHSAPSPNACGVNLHVPARVQAARTGHTGAALPPVLARDRMVAVARDLMVATVGHRRSNYAERPAAASAASADRSDIKHYHEDRGMIHYQDPISPFTMPTIFTASGLDKGLWSPEIERAAQRAMNAPYSHAARPHPGQQLCEITIS